MTIPDAGRYLVLWKVTAENTDGAPQNIVVNFNEVTPAASVLASSESVDEVAQNDVVTVSGFAVVDATAGSTYNFTNGSTGQITIQSATTNGATEIVFVRVG